MGLLPAKARVYGKLKSKMGPKGLQAAGVLLAVAGLGALIGGLVTSQKKKRREGSDAWRVAVHQPFLLNLTSGDGATWRREIRQASNDQLCSLTDLTRKLYDDVFPLPSDDKLPLKKHTREIRCFRGFTTSLFERRALLLALGARLLPFVWTGFKSVTGMGNKYAREMILIPNPSTIKLEVISPKTALISFGNDGC